MGVGVATSGEISFKDGRAEQDNFNTYEVTRISGAPREIRVHIVPGDYSQPLGGVGEPGVPPIPPGALQRDLRGDGQAHPAPADPRSAEGVSAGRESPEVLQ